MNTKKNVDSVIFLDMTYIIRSDFKMSSVYYLSMRHNVLVKSHNIKIISAPDLNSPTCNCVNTSDCRLDGKCLTKSVVYCAKVHLSDGSMTKSYIGLTGLESTKRIYQHRLYFANSQKAFRNCIIQIHGL